MKNSKICPKCDSTEIYTKSKASDGSGQKMFFVGSFTAMYMDLYVCRKCGYVEQYVCEKDMNDNKKWDKLKKKWKALFY